MQRDIKQPEDAGKRVLGDDGDRRGCFLESEGRPYWLAASKYELVRRQANISQCECLNKIRASISCLGRTG